MINDLENRVSDVVIERGLGIYFALTCGFTRPDDLRLLVGCSQIAKRPAPPGKDRKVSEASARSTGSTRHVLCGS